MARFYTGTTVWQLYDLIDHVHQCMTEITPGRWVPARPLGWTAWDMRLKAVWLVWTGRADVVQWPGQP